MNRLVIIGNGFDLAHGLPTSYKDFIDDYFVEKFNTFLSEGVYEDKLITIKLIERITIPKTEIKSISEVYSFIRRYSSYVRLTYNSQFFKKLKDRLDKINWVDIESEYFETLLNCKDRKGYFDYSKVKNLNDEFNCLRESLEKHLLNIDIGSSLKIKSDYQHHFCSSILKEDVVFKKMDLDEVPKELLFLNFNYTDTLNQYYEKCSRRMSTNVNFIHGELRDSENPLIFGFGDEFDKNYKNFEDERNNTLFSHIKSFGYFKTPNYHNLIRFLDLDEFQVFIFGHSCGLSDRTMLKEIFENEKCISIKIFYYERPDGSNDYIEKTMEISRHFEDKGLMRKKIVPFPLSKHM
jgi:hypothetical protein